MKRLLTIFAVIFSLSLPSLFSTPEAKAQGYYGYAVPGYYFSPYGCLVGCGKAYTAAAAINLAVDTAAWGIQFQEVTKAREAQIRQYQYQAEANKWAANAPQRMVDYYNILSVQSFFFDDDPASTQGKTSGKTPKVKSFSTKSKQESF